MNITRLQLPTLYFANNFPFGFCRKNGHNHRTIQRAQKNWRYKYAIIWALANQEARFFFVCKKSNRFVDQKRLPMAKRHTSADTAKIVLNRARASVKLTPIHAKVCAKVFARRAAHAWPVCTAQGVVFAHL